MNNRQNNKSRMHIGVNKHCSKPEHAEAVAKIPAFQREYDDFKSTSAQIRAEAKKQKTAMSTGITEDKDTLRSNMADMAARVCASIQSYADATGDRELFASVDYTRTSFTGGREIDAANLAEGVLAIGTEKLEVLGDYGVDQAQLDELDDTIEGFSNAIGKPRAKISERKTVTDSLPDLFAKADKHLEQMDRLTKQLEVSFAEFVQGYRNARIIVDYRTPGKKGEGENAAEVEGSETTEPMQPVVLPDPVDGESADVSEDVDAA